MKFFSKAAIASYVMMFCFVLFSKQAYASDSKVVQKELTGLSSTKNEQVVVMNDKNEFAEKLEYCNGISLNKEDIINSKLSNEIVVKANKLNSSKTTNNINLDIRQNENSELLYDFYEASDEEKFLLAVIIFCEAGGEKYEGKIAVGNVVLNRVVSERFDENDIESVIRAKGQFSPVGSGWFDKELKKGEVDETCIQAAEDALNGINLAGKSLFFHRVSEADTNCLIIGNHAFY